MQRAILLIGLLTVFPVLAVAQPPLPTLPDMPKQAPIDGGLTLLAAAGGAYAWRRLRSPEKP